MRDAGKLFRVSERTVRNWEAGRVLVPYAAFKLMRILRGYELPGAAWKGYRLVGDTLWSPEGLAFRADEQRWWWLTVSMARQFRVLMAQRYRRPMRASEASPHPTPVALTSGMVLPSKPNRSVRPPEPAAETPRQAIYPLPAGGVNPRVVRAADPPCSNTGVNVETRFGGRPPVVAL